MTGPGAKEASRVLIVGADLVMPKLFYFADELRNIGYGQAIYTHDDTPESRAIAERAGAAFIAGPPHRKSIGRMLSDAWTFCRRLSRRDYHHADLYCDYHILAAFMYLLILWVKRVPIVVWCRGELLDWDAFTWQRLYFRAAMRLSKLVVLKERYMIATLKRAGIYREAKTIELHNTIPLPPWDDQRPRFAGPPVRLLFLNTFKLWRGAPFCIEVAAALRDAQIPFTLKMVGEKTESPGLVEESRRIRDQIAAHGLGNIVSVHPFTTEPAPYFEEADIYLLPATLIYCNYGLLEAMAQGLVPIVNSHDADYALILEDGVSGFGLPLDPSIWVDTIRSMVERPNEARAMSRAARTRMENRFSTGVMFARYARAAGLVEPGTGGGAEADLGRRQVR